MPDEITADALRTLSDLKRRGVIPTVRPCCGQHHCICEHAPHLYSLRDHASDPEAYDRALGEPTRLRVLTMPTSTADHDAPMLQPDCREDPMICRCPQHEAERNVFLKRGAIGAGRAQFKVKTSRRAA